VEALHLRYFERARRNDGRVLPVEERDLLREVEGGLDRAALEREVHRCFSCGSCLACDNCWTLCPDSAVLKTPEPGEDGSPYVFDLDYCEGRGICAEQCPSGFIEMASEYSTTGSGR
jgi:formate dehydrogenase beta subunit